MRQEGWLLSRELASRTREYATQFDLTRRLRCHVAARLDSTQSGALREHQCLAFQPPTTTTCDVVRVGKGRVALGCQGTSHFARCLLRSPLPHASPWLSAHRRHGLLPRRPGRPVCGAAFRRPALGRVSSSSECISPDADRPRLSADLLKRPPFPAAQVGSRCRGGGPGRCGAGGAAPESCSPAAAWALERWNRSTRRNSAPRPAPATTSSLWPRCSRAALGRWLGLVGASKK